MKKPKKKAVRNERPKSREETPKEGYDKQARLADVAMQKLRMQRTNNNCNYCIAPRTLTQGCHETVFLVVFQTPRCLADWPEKRPSETNGPSLGRKRPKWATIAAKRVSATVDAD
jgi:hypothetical protein